MSFDKLLDKELIHEHSGEEIEGGKVGGVIPVESISFDNLYTNTGTEPIGTMFWNEVDGTIDIRLKNNATLQTGQELHFYGKASGDILNGELCQFAGVQGDHILIKKVVPAEVIASPHYLVGVATQNITNGTFGYVTWFGKVNGVYTKTPNNNDTADWVAGDILYFNNSTGQLTKTAPTAPNRRITVAAVIKIQTGSAENGIILIRPTFSSKLEDLEDVDGSTPNATGDLLTWNNSTLTWERNAYNINDYYTETEADDRFVNVTGDTMQGDLDFAKYKAIQLVCDNGTSFPATPASAQWFYRSDQDTLFLYEGGWKPIINFSAINLYVATTGSDTEGNGYDVSTPCATLAYAWTLVPSVFSGNVTINMAAGNYAFPGLTGKSPGGAYIITILGATTTTLANTSMTSFTAGSGTTNDKYTISTATWGIGTVKDSGTNTSVTANKLVDSTQNFSTTIKIGMQVKNTTDNTWAHVTAVDSNTTLSLDADIFTATSKAYSIGWGDFKGHIVHFDEATATTSLRGSEHMIYENNTTQLELVGRTRTITSLPAITPTVSDTFRLLKPATVFTSSTISSSSPFSQKALKFQYCAWSGSGIFDYSDSSIQYYSCWFIRGTQRYNRSYVNYFVCCVDSSGGGTTTTFTALSPGTLFFPQKTLFNLAEGSSKTITFTASQQARTNNSFCNIVENGTGLSITGGAYVATEVVTSLETGWQYYRNTNAVDIGAGSTYAGATDVYSGNTVNQTNRFLPTGNLSTTGQLYIDGNTDIVQLRVQAHSTQTANLTTWEDSNGTVLASITGDGRWGIGIAPQTQIKYYINSGWTDPTATAESIRNAMVNTYTASNSFQSRTNANYLYLNVGNTFTATGIQATYHGSLYLKSTNAGTISNAYGNYFYSGLEAGASGTVSNMALYYGTHFSSGANTANYVNWYGFYLEDISALLSGGTITNHYGIYLKNIDAGSTTNYAIVTNAGNIVFNEGGDANTDFRVEGDTRANLLMVDASDDAVMIDGGVEHHIETKSANYTLTTKDYFVVFTASATAILPAATGSGRVFVIKNRGVGSVIIDPNSTELIDGELTQTIEAGESAQVIDYASGNWAVI